MKTRAERRKQRKLERKAKGDRDWIGAIMDFILLPFEILLNLFD